MNQKIWVGLLLSLSVLILILTGAWLAPHDPLAVDLSHRLMPPDSEYILGTDHLGRCVLSRVIYGARTSPLAAMAAISLALLIGVPMGIISGLGSRKSDTVIMSICDVLLAFPFLILALVLTGIMGTSLKSLIFGVGISAWAWWARFVRGMVLSAKEKDFVKAAVSMGLSNFRIIRRCIIPQVLPPLLVSVSLSAGKMMVVISGLSYLGLGVQPPTPEWGMMLREARLYMSRSPWLVLAPGAAISLSVLAFTLIGEGLRDYFQVRPNYEIT